MMMVFTPILILLLILFIVFSGIKKTTQKASFINSRRIKWFLGGYIAVLLASVGFTYLISIEEYEGVNADISIDEAERMINEFYQARHQSDFEKIEGVFITDEWSFPIDGNSLNLRVAQDGFYGTFMLVEKKATEDDIVDVIRFSTPQILQRWDLTHLGISPQLELENNTLTIFSPERTRVNLAAFHKEFTITQFTGEKMFMDNHYFGSGGSMLYIKVPANVEIINGEEVYFDYVNP